MKKFVKVAFAAVFAAVVGYGVYTTQKADTISELAFVNIEALAQSEGIGNVSCCGNYGICGYNLDGSMLFKGIKSYGPCY